ncbi:NAD-dependent epimerase/dehydratase family protein [Actinotalea ferrariae]|uniref:NAD-dependent epimerase/dehydratase family protein n=1 Tax=Actinotalea ferrariae TaxID=1386098 RepID=UPI001C8BB50F|nr:NAD-dependent epimerase/dehydratase family protein [Actinotalea ferrariae]
MDAPDRRAEAAGRTVVVAGGAGFVGRFVVDALLAEGARVLLPTRRPGSVVVPEHDRLAVVGVASWDEPVEIATALAGRGWTADAAVVALGGWWIGTPLLDLAPTAWRGLLESHLTAHLLAARALLPLLATAAAAGADAAYVTLNGAAAREPMALSGPVSVAGAGQTMLLDVLRAEGTPVRLHEVAVLAAVAGDDRNLDPVASVRGEDVARTVLAVLGDTRAPASVDVTGTTA